jgi:hypothetical protein
MDDIQSFVMYPFLNGIFTKLSVTSHFWEHNVQPLDTGIVVIVQKCGRRETFNGVATFEDTAKENSKVQDLFRCPVSGPNFSLTKAERHTLLMLTKPTNRTTVL